MFRELAITMVACMSAAIGITAKVDTWPSVETDHTKLQVVVPQKLQKKGGYPHKDALFGNPDYATGSLQIQLILANGDGCAPFDNSKWQSPFALIIERGGCHFVEKVRRAQHAGAAAVLIADDRCLCTDMECMTDTKDVMCEVLLPFMADDASGGDITIPSMIIRKNDAAQMKRVLTATDGSANSIMVKFDWGIPAPDGRVEWTMWHSAWDEQSKIFLKQMEKVVLGLGDRAFFTPHFVSYNGTRNGCHIGDIYNPCGNMCLNEGRYCLLDPSPFHDQFKGASGADVVKENLRRKCIWTLESKKDPGIGRKWWRYVVEFDEKCATREESFKDKDCAEGCMKKLGINIDAVNHCMGPNGANLNEVNPVLEEELEQQTHLQLLRLPAVYVDGAHARGRISVGNMISMICAGYGLHDPPSVCSCVNQSPAEMQDCVENGGFLNSAAAMRGGGVGTGTVVMIATLVGLALASAGFVYYRRQQLLMREQVRSILAEYVPLEQNEVDPNSPKMHPAEVASMASPRGFLPTNGFDDDDEEGV